jgi:hypothetical protein
LRGTKQSGYKWISPNSSTRPKSPGFTYPNGEQAHLFSSVNKSTVLRHFEWIQQYRIDGVWLQRFVVDLEGGPLQQRYPSMQKVLHNVHQAASRTGRIWALSNVPEVLSTFGVDSSSQIIRMKRSIE